MLCSACDPEIGKWHGRFERKYLAKGQFVTDRQGNLAHKDSVPADQGAACGS